MSEKKLIGIALIPEKAFDVDVNELPVVKVDRLGEGSYIFPDRLYIDMALETLLNAGLETISMAFLILEIEEKEEEPVPEERTRRRRRRRATPRRHQDEAYKSCGKPTGTASPQGNARGEGGVS